jgi:hypothetical protein
VHAQDERRGQQHGCRRTQAAADLDHAAATDKDLGSSERDDESGNGEGGVNDDHGCVGMRPRSPQGAACGSGTDSFAGTARARGLLRLDRCADVAPSFGPPLGGG